MSIYPVEVHDLPKVLDQMAHKKDPILPDMSRHDTRLDRMKDYTAALSARLPQQRSRQPPMTARTVRTSRTGSPPAMLPLRRQAKSMSNEMYCGPCGRDNLHHEAAGYCIECSEYFCENCIKHHKNLKITKSHVVRDRKKMPKIRHQIEDEESMEVCEFHDGEMIRYYCKNHNEPCCTVCATLNHRPCTDLIFIPEIKAKKTTKDCVKMIKHIHSITNQFEKTKEDTKKNIQQFDLQKTDFQQSILKVHRDVLDLLYNVEKEIARTMKYVHDDENSFLTARVDLCDEAIKNLQQASNHLDLAKQNGVESKCFLQLKKVAKQVSYYESLLEDIQKKNQGLLRYKFKVDDKVKDFIKNVKSLGSLEITDHPIRAIAPLTQFDVKSRSDAYEVCDITGTAILDDGRVILTDMYNESLKLVDSSYNMVTQTKLSAEPWDVCAISNEQVVVSLPREKKLQFFAIGASLRPLKKIGNTPSSVKASQFYGVAYLQEKLYVTCPKDEPPNIKILDMQGRTLQQLNTNQQEQNLFSDPLYIALKQDGKTIYVSDSGNNMIIKLDSNQDGKNLTFLVPENPPGGLTVQADGGIYFCGFKTNNIQQLSEDFKYVDEITGSEGGLLNPQSISYCSRERRLIVTMQKSNTVKVFQLS